MSVKSGARGLALTLRLEGHKFESQVFMTQDCRRLKRLHLKPIAWHLPEQTTAILDDTTTSF